MPVPPTNVTTRSRSLLFFSYRDSVARPRRRRTITTLYHDNDDNEDDERQGLIPSSSHRPEYPATGHIALDVELPPKWVDISEQVDHIISAVQTKIQALDKLHAKHVLPGFTDRSAEERDIETATASITRDFRQCHSLIQRISPSLTHTFPPSQPRSKTDYAAQNVQRALAAKVQELSGTFRKKQRIYMEKLQGHAIKNQDFLLASGAISLEGSEGYTALEDDVRATQDIQNSQVQIQNNPSSETQQRTHELNEIAKSIASLAELFKDLSTLVIDQGTILDSVEYNVEQTAVNVEEAVKELQVATTYQKNTGRRKCIFLLILIILGLILVLIFKPRRHDSPPPKPSAGVLTSLGTDGSQPDMFVSPRFSPRDANEQRENRSPVPPTEGASKFLPISNERQQTERHVTTLASQENRALRRRKAPNPDPTQRIQDKQASRTQGLSTTRLRENLGQRRFYENYR